jgi:hypothetical protein
MTITPRADSYTAGSTLYHMLTGKSPLSLLPDVIRSLDEHAVQPEKWDWKLLERKARRPTVEFIRACLDPLPGNRPAGGEELYTTLTQLVATS